MGNEYYDAEELKKLEEYKKKTGGWSDYVGTGFDTKEVECKPIEKKSLFARIFKRKREV